LCEDTAAQGGVQRHALELVTGNSADSIKAREGPVHPSERRGEERFEVAGTLERHVVDEIFGLSRQERGNGRREPCILLGRGVARSERQKGEIKAAHHRARARIAEQTSRLASNFFLGAETALGRRRGERP